REARRLVSRFVITVAVMCEAPIAPLRERRDVAPDMRKPGQRVTGLSGTSSCQMRPFQSSMIPCQSAALRK
ncbi:MAG TPA: hypothetical protein VEH31_25145, partial [Streptosporangiaceae bacterium]|nr:hypothetical protein [Streptosporangiaceae bacterium]